MEVSPSTGLSLDDNLVSSLLDLTSDIASCPLIKPSNQSSDCLSKGRKSANVTLKLLLSKTNPPTKGTKLWETPKEAPKQAKRKEIKGQAILTLELLTMEKT